MLENNLNVYRAALISRQPYTIPFIFWRASDLQVWVTKDGVDTLLDPSEYTITGSAVSTGEDIASSDSTISDADHVITDEKVTLTEEAYQTYADYDVITFMRVVNPVQDIDYTNGTNINAEVIERSLDQLVAITQQHEEALKRTINLSVSEEGGNLMLPDAPNRANTMMGFGPDGNTAVVRSLEEFDADVEAAAGYASSALESKNAAQTSSETASTNASVATQKAGEASASATAADNARLESVTEQTSSEDEGINTITMTYKDGTSKSFTVRNGSQGPKGDTGSVGPQGPPGSAIDAYPVGSIYMSRNSTSPASLFGGTWSPIEDKFLMARGSSYTASGGSATVTLLEANLPAHSHGYTPSGSVTGGAYAFSGTRTTTEDDGAHSHTLSLRAGDCSGASKDNLNRWDGSTYDYSTSTAGSHSHYYTPSGSVSVTTNPTFTGTADTTDTTGSGDPISILPPFDVVYAWERIA